MDRKPPDLLSGKLLSVALVLLIVPLLFGACRLDPIPESELKPPPGKCKANADCPVGTACAPEGRCKDIYFPREKIKNY
jgi:hypothetical protein